jgi:hypothetical protein
MTDKLSLHVVWSVVKQIYAVTDPENLISGVSYIIINYIKLNNHLSVRIIQVYIFNSHEMVIFFKNFAHLKI